MKFNFRLTRVNFPIISSVVMLVILFIILTFQHGVLGALVVLTLTFGIGAGFVKLAQIIMKRLPKE